MAKHFKGSEINPEQKITTSIVILSVMLLLSIVSTGANAGLCLVGQVKEVGTWVNPDSNTRGITKAIFGEEAEMTPELSVAVIFAKQLTASNLYIPRNSGASAIQQTVTGAK